MSFLQLIIFCVIFGVALAQRHDQRDCDHGQSSYGDSGDYTPHTLYGPPRRNFPHQDTDEGENSLRPSYAQPPPSYSQNRPAPVYGPPPSRSRVAQAAGIYDDYEDILYAQPAAPVQQAVARRYNVNYAHREPYYPIRYDAYAIRRPEYRVPIYYTPLIPDGFIPVHSHALSSGTTEKTATNNDEGKSQPAPESYHSDHQHTSSSSSTEQEVYDEGQVRRQQPTVVAVNPSPLQNEIKRHLFRKPFLGLRNLFRGSILAKRNKIGLIPSFVQGATSSF